MPMLIENKIIIYAETPRGGELAWKAAMIYLDWLLDDPNRTPHTRHAPCGYVYGEGEDAAKFAVWQTETGSIVVRQKASDEWSWLWRGEDV